MKKISQLQIFTLTLIIIIFFVKGISNIFEVEKTFQYPQLCEKDLIQDYIQANSIWNNKSLNSSVNDQVKELVPECANIKTFPHRTPHPPSSFIFYGFGVFFDYKTFCLVWFGLSLLLVGLITLILSRIVRLKYSNLLILIVLINSQPLMIDLQQGQCNLLLLVLGLELAFGSKSNIIKGFILGLTLSAKLFGLPLLFLWVLTKKKISACVASTTFLIALLLSCHGSLNEIKLYFENLKLVSKLYQFELINISLWSSLNKIFIGTRSDVLSNPTFEPLFNVPFFVMPVYLLSISLMLLLLIKLFKKYNSNFPQIVNYYFYIFSLVVSPVIWIHSLILCLPIFIIKFSSSYNNKELKSMVIFFILIFICNFNIFELIENKPQRLIDCFGILIPTYIIILCFFSFSINRNQKKINY